MKIGGKCKGVAGEAQWETLTPALSRKWEREWILTPTLSHKWEREWNLTPTLTHRLEKGRGRSGE